LELVAYLSERYGSKNVIATDIRIPTTQLKETEAKCVYLDVTDQGALSKLVVENEITTIIHLASLLSAVGEKNPQLAMKVNVRGSENVLEVASQHSLRVFIPSTIAVFGPTTPRDMTPDLTVLRPTTIYGTTKARG
jgi:threonine 3-dehydrogenase